MLGEALGLLQRRRSIDQPAQTRGEPTAGRRQPVLADLAGVAAVPQRETVLQNRLHRARPRTVGIVLLQLFRAAQQVPKTGLVRRVLEAAIRHPPVAHQHAGEIAPEHCRRVVEPAAVADGVDRRLRRGERPQPVADRVYPPARLIGRDQWTATDLLAQSCIRGRRRGGRAVQQMDQAALGHRQTELRPQNAGDLPQRHAQLGMQLDDQRGDVRTQLRAGRAQRVGSL